MSAKRAGILDRVRNIFHRHRLLWSLISICSLGAVIFLWIGCAFLGPVSAVFRPAALLVAGALLIAFVLGIFWRGSIVAFLTFAGAASSYLSFYIYARFGDMHSLPQLVTNKLGVGKLVSGGSPTTLAEMYFLSAIFAFSFALVLSYKPSLFWARGSRANSTYPLWTNSNEQKSAVGNSAMLVPLQGLLSYAERHIAARYLYIVVEIAGKKYFVKPDDWVPQGSFVLRNRRSGYLLGIPKVSDGFNLW